MSLELLAMPARSDGARIASVSQSAGGEIAVGNGGAAPIGTSNEAMLQDLSVCS